MSFYKYQSTSGRQNRKRKTSFCMYRWHTIRFVAHIHFWFVVVVIFSVSLQRKKYTCKLILPLLLNFTFASMWKYFYTFSCLYTVEKNRYVKFFFLFLCTPLDIVLFFSIFYLIFGASASFGVKF